MFKGSKHQRRAIRMLGVFILVALLAPVLANRNPLMLRIDGKTSFPALGGNPYVELPQENGEWKAVLAADIDWRTFQRGFTLLAPIPYAPADLDPANANFQSPFSKQFLASDTGSIELPLRYRHWLGTTRTGGDLLSALIHGTRYALLIGFLAALLSALIGITLGLFAGYFGDRHFLVHPGSFILILALFFIAWFEGSFIPGRYGLQTSLGWWLLPLIGMLLTLRVRGKKATLRLPIDTMVRAVMSVFLAVPRLVWIILIGATLTPSVSLVILTIGLTGWAEFTQLTRAETLRLRGSGFAENARAAGFAGCTDPLPAFVTEFRIPVGPDLFLSHGRSDPGRVRFVVSRCRCSARYRNLGKPVAGRSTGFAGVVGAGISGLLPVPALEQPSVHAKNHRFLTFFNLVFTADSSFLVKIAPRYEGFRLPPSFPNVTLSKPRFRGLGTSTS